MPSLKDLFKTKPLPTQNNKVGSEVYAVRNSKDIPITTANGILNATVFPLVQKTLRSSSVLTNRKKETVVESELVGLRSIKILSSPVLYNRELLRIVRQTTNSLEFMKTASNGGSEALGDFERTGVIGKLIDKGQALAENVMSKLGIELPQRLIPSRVAYNKKFREELEPNTMSVLASIKKDGAGNLVGKFLQKNINIGPPKMTVKIAGAIVTELKKGVRRKLFGSPLEGAKNLARKDQDGILYDRKSFYGIGGTVIPEQSDITLRNDLSTILDAQRTLWETTMASGDTAAKITAGIPNLPIANSITSNSKISNPSPFTPISDLIKNTGIKNRAGLTLARKAGQKELAKPENNTGTNFQFRDLIIYSDTVDAGANEISLRNDLSTTLENLKNSPTGFPVNNSVDTTSVSNRLPSLTESQFGNPADKIKAATTKNQSNLSAGRLAGQRELAKPENINNNFQFNDGVEYSNTVDETADEVQFRNDLSTKLQSLNTALALFSPVTGGIDRTNTKYSQKEFNEKTLARRNWDTKSDFINSKPPYGGSNLVLSNNESLDEYDFIAVKFNSVLGNTSVNFTAVVDGISETVSPTWDSAKFLGSPFNYYTYSGIERTVSFNLKLFALNPAEHVIMWQKIDYLTSLAYPISYSITNTYIIPPFLKFTMGNLYKNKECFISSLSYTMEDTGGWELGTPILGDSRIDVAGNQVDLNEYKCPRHVSVSISLTFVESRGNTSGQKYGFQKQEFSTNNITNVS